jgi:hypothetical protein
MISRFLKLKTYKSLMNGIQRELSPFFKFKEVGILFYDSEKDKFFTIQIEPIAPEPKVKKSLTKVLAESLKHMVSKLDHGNDMSNLCPTHKELIFYPSNLGLSGYTFQNSGNYSVNNNQI